MAPRTSLEKVLVGIWQEILGLEQVGVQDNFFDLGGHSLLAVRLIAQIQKQFGQDLPLAMLFQGATIRQLTSLLRQQINPLPWSPLVVIQPGGSKRPLFCVHPAGGNITCYYNLAHYLGSEQPFYGLQALGFDEEQEPLTQVEDMATYYIRALQAIQSQGPYLLAGWSFGGLVAFEMAQQLQAQGQQVSFLGLLDTYAPSVAPEAPQDDAALLVNLFAEGIALSLEHLQQLGSDEQLIYVMEQARQVNQLSPDFGLPQARRLLQVYKSNSQAAQNYMVQHYSGLVTIFKASEEAAVGSQDPTLGWRELVAEGVEVYWVPGNHQTMIRKPHVQVLAEQLYACLEQAQAKG
jgi:thioesterase domain-containing protein/acyl carrier protein